MKTSATPPVPIQPFSAPVQALNPRPHHQHGRTFIQHQCDRYPHPRLPHIPRGEVRRKVLSRSSGRPHRGQSTEHPRAQPHPSPYTGPNPPRRRHSARRAGDHRRSGGPLAEDYHPAWRAEEHGCGRPHGSPSRAGQASATPPPTGGERGTNQFAGFRCTHDHTGAAVPATPAGTGCADPHGTRCAYPHTHNDRDDIATHPTHSCRVHASVGHAVRINRLGVPQRDAPMYAEHAWDIGSRRIDGGTSPLGHVPPGVKPDSRHRPAPRSNRRSFSRLHQRRQHPSTIPSSFPRQHRSRTHMVHFRTHPRRLCTHTPPSFLGLATTSGYPRLQRTWPHITTYPCDHFSDGVYDYGRLRLTHTGDCGGRVNGSYDGSGTPLCSASLHCSRPAQG